MGWNCQDSEFARPEGLGINGSGLFMPACRGKGENALVIKLSYQLETRRSLKKMIDI